jgi:hypothetical protein
MLEKPSDQAHGLLALELRPVTRVVPVVVSPGRLDSLELLWALESGLQRMGLAVGVVEGLHGLTPHDAAQGHRAVLTHWLEGVPPGTVTLLHAPLDALAVLLADSLARPLVALGSEAASLVQSYNAVKVLWQVAGLQAIVMPLAEHTVGQADAATALQNTLRDLSAHRLDMTPAIWPLEYHANGSRNPCGGAEACLLKVLDSALMLQDFDESSHHVDTHSRRCQTPADQNIGVSHVHRQRHA